MRGHLEGRDPVDGSVLRVTHEGARITSITRLGPSGDATLPTVAPGIIDLQVNGYAGYDVNAPDVAPEEISSLTRALGRQGVTTWVPTVVTAAEEHIVHALRVVAAARRADPVVAAAVPCVHVEGPFLSPAQGARGVHDPAHIRPIDAAEVARWQAAGPLGYVTVSPHWEGALAEITAIVAMGVTVAIGHTDAEPEQIRAAVDAGATLSTHLGNGVAVQLPRHPNPIWSQLGDDRLTCGFIADGHHLPDETLRAMLRAKGPGRAFLVSDAVALAGSPPGRYVQSVGGEVELHHDRRLSHAGTAMLAGSAVSNADCLRHVIARCGYSLAAALPLVTSVPGGILAARGMDAADGVGRRGVLQAGGRADLLLIDSHGSVLHVVQSGRALRAERDVP